MTFMLCEHISGIQMYAWLSQSDFYRTDDNWDDTRVLGFEDSEGEMIPHDVRVADLEVLMTHPQNKDYFFKRKRR